MCKILIDPTFVFFGVYKSFQTQIIYTSVFFLISFYDNNKLSDKYFDGVKHCVQVCIGACLINVNQ